MGISRLGNAERTYLADGVISKEEAVELSKLAKSGDLAEARHILERDAFTPEARAELEKLVRNHQPVSIFAGTRIGTNRYGEEVRVTRELGNLKGYDDRLQAIAVARMGGAEPAAVIQGTDQRWHAVETTANFWGGGTSADGPTLAVHGLPAAGPIADFEKKLAEVNKQLDALPSTSPERNPLLLERGELRREMAKFVFGVEDSELAFTRSSSSRKAGKINIDAELDQPQSEVYGLHGPEADVGDRFDPTRPTAFEISPGVLDTPHKAESVLFHEVSHLEDFKAASLWVGRYEKETGHVFVASATEPFEKWLNKQAPRRLSAADAETIAAVARGGSAQTEARAYVHAFVAALEAGAPEVATMQLLTYAKGLRMDSKANNRVEGLPTGSSVEKALTAELKAAWKDMTKEQRAWFSDAVAQAKSANSSAWVSSLAFK